MTGRLSLEQAKAIREKRELEQELGECLVYHSTHLARTTLQPFLRTLLMLRPIEDVQQFAAKMTGRSSRSAAKNAKAAKADSSDEDMGGSDDEKIISDEEAVPKRVSR